MITSIRLASISTWVHFFCLGRSLQSSILSFIFFWKFTVRKIISYIRSRHEPCVVSLCYVLKLMELLYDDGDHLNTRWEPPNWTPKIQPVYLVFLIINVPITIAHMCLGQLSKSLNRLPVDRSKHWGGWVRAPVLKYFIKLQ